MNTKFSSENYYRMRRYVEAAFAVVLFFEIMQNSQENTCCGISFLIKLQAWPANNNTTKFRINRVFYLKCLYNVWLTWQGIIHLVRTQNFPKY